MIQISDKTQCCGCSSCAQRCPKKCISMVQDEEGFSYPQVDADFCIDCGLCEKVCPILSPKQAHEPLKVFAAKNPDDSIRRESSSGGIFTMLAESIIREGGVVFGVRWSKEWNVEHSYTETIEGLKAFRGSKYVQSNINGSYKKAEALLKEGRKVLYFGTPCQIAGLKAYLRNEYDNLLTVECACHGVPSPGLWQTYFSEVTKGKSVLSINHRDKRTGWRNYSVVVRFTDGKEIAQAHDDNPWTRAFIKNLTLRPSCHSCLFKCKSSLADVTLADLWGNRQFLQGENDDKGMSLVILHTQQGIECLKTVSEVKAILFEEAVRYNGALVSSPKPNASRSLFFTQMNSGRPFVRTIKNLTKDPLTLRMKIMISKLIKH